jgi:hypothetical protein
MNNISRELKTQHTIEFSEDVLYQIQDYTSYAIACCYHSDVNGLIHCIRTISNCAKTLTENSNDLKAFEQEAKND